MQADSNDYHVVSAAALNLVMHFEGLRLHEYRDVAGVPTIGYGHRIQPGDDIVSPMSQADARALLVHDLTIAGIAVNNYVAVPISQNQFDALVSFVFNVGISSFKHSTLLAMLNARDYAGAANQFLRWNHAVIDGKLQPVPGLTARRIAERELFVT